MSLTAIDPVLPAQAATPTPQVSPLNPQQQRVQKSIDTLFPVQITLSPEAQAALAASGTSN